MSRNRDAEPPGTLPVRQGGLMVLVILLASSMLLNSAHGQGDASKDGPDPCANSATEADMLRCRHQEFADSESEVDGLYQQLMNSYAKDEPGLHPLLQQAQAAWRDYRDAQCRVDTYYSASGSAYEIYWLECLEKANGARALQLEWLIESP